MTLTMKRVLVTCLGTALTLSGCGAGQPTKGKLAFPSHPNRVRLLLRRLIPAHGVISGF